MTAGKDLGMVYERDTWGLDVVMKRVRRRERMMQSLKTPSLQERPEDV